MTKELTFSGKYTCSQFCSVGGGVPLRTPDLKVI